MANDFDNYRTMLRVNKHRLDDELELQAEIMLRIGDELEARTSRASAAKDELARVEARLAEGLRDSEEKLSIATVDARVRKHRERFDAFTKLEAAKADEGRWSRLYDAWKERGFSIRALGNLFQSGYFASDPIVGHERSRRDPGYAERQVKMLEGTRRRPPSDDDDVPRRRRVDA